jgi:4-amino-4-deoxychorismate lyase
MLQSCLETICLLDGQLLHLDYHEARLNRTRLTLYGSSAHWSLQELLANYALPSQGLFKCRLIYHRELVKFEWEPYQRRPIASLKKVYNDHISYSHKYLNRSALNDLFAQKALHDDVLIIKNGRLTDTSYCNIAVYNGTEWHTPTSPLLLGTQRAYLIDTEKIKATELEEKNLPNYSRIRLFNAMIHWDDAIELSMDAIF